MPTNSNQTPAATTVNQPVTPVLTTPSAIKAEPVVRKPKSTPAISRPTSMPSINEAIQQYQVNEKDVERIRENPGLSQASSPILTTSTSKTSSTETKPAEKPKTAPQPKLKETKKAKETGFSLFTPVNLLIGAILFMIGLLAVIIGSSLTNFR